MAKQKTLIMIMLALVLLVCSTFVYADVWTGLISYWNLDSDTTDSAGSNDCVNYGADATNSCKNNGCYNFVRGNTDYINCSNPASLRPTRITISAWINYTSLDGQYLGGLPYYLDDWSSPYATFNFYMYGASTDLLFISTGDNYQNKDTAATWTTNQWYHIVIAWNGTHGLLYQDGSIILADDGTFADGDLTYTGSAPFPEFFIGDIGPGNPGYSANAIIDEFAVWDRALTSSEVSELYNSGDGLFYSPVTESISVTFNNQTPADIDATNILPPNAFFTTFNISHTSALNLSTVLLRYQTNCSYNTSIWINGSAQNRCLNKTYDFNVSDTFTFELDEHEVYPATYNRDQELMENQVHQNTTFSGSNQWLKIEFLNVSSQKQDTFFEMMVMNETAGESPLQFYYCNSTYSTGNPTINDNCGNFLNLNAQGWNHTHSSVSSHMFIPMTIVDSKVAAVGVTETSYILVRGDPGWRYFYVNNATRTDVTQLSNNNGGSWSSQTFDIDAHFHQYDGTDTFYYFGQACDVNNLCANSTVQSDVIEVPEALPSAPTFITANNLINNTQINITWNPSVDPENNSLVYFVFFDTNPDPTTLKAVINVTHWETDAAATDVYYYKVFASDNITGNSSSLIQNFTYDVTDPVCTFTNPLEDNTSSIYNTTATFTATCTDNNLLYSFNLSMDDVDSKKFNISKIDSTTYNFNEDFDFSNETLGNNITLSFRYCDAHTTRELTELSEDRVVVSGPRIYYDDFNLESLDPELSRMETTKEMDRWSQTITYDTKLTEYRFRINADKVHKVKNSRYKGHYIINDKYWLDAEGNDGLYVDEGDGIFKIVTSRASDSLQLNSVGELNCIEESLEFTVIAQPVLPDTIMPRFIFSSRTPQSITEVLTLFMMFIIWAFFLIMMFQQRTPLWVLMQWITGLIVGVIFLNYFVMFGIALLVLCSTIPLLAFLD